MISREFITELFDTDTSFPIRNWDVDEDSYAVIATAYDSNKSPIQIFFTPLHEEIDAIDFDFSRSGTFEKTGEGDAGKVFATVIKALTEYLQRINKPDYMLIASKGSSRTRAYQTMIKRYAAKFGYKEISYSQLPSEITDQPTPEESKIFVLAKI
jgi:hypothetical protein